LFFANSIVKNAREKIHQTSKNYIFYKEFFGSTTTKNGTVVAKLFAAKKPKSRVLLCVCKSKSKPEQGAGMFSYENLLTAVTHLFPAKHSTTQVNLCVCSNIFVNTAPFSTKQKPTNCAYFSE
jgi:hypothetical protein